MTEMTQWDALENMHEYRGIRELNIYFTLDIKTSFMCIKDLNVNGP